jgi:hypothetical protein
MRPQRQTNDVQLSLDPADNTRHALILAERCDERISRSNPSAHEIFWIAAVDYLAQNREECLFGSGKFQLIEDALHAAIGATQNSPTHRRVQADWIFQNLMYYRDGDTFCIDGHPIRDDSTAAMQEHKQQFLLTLYWMYELDSPRAE